MKSLFLFVVLAPILCSTHRCNKQSFPITPELLYQVHNEHGNVRMAGENLTIAQHGQFPWHVMLVSYKPNNKHRTCSAVVISDRWLLTAAHCTHDGLVHVVGNSTGPSFCSDNSSTSASSAYFRHPEFHGNHHNIALVRLALPLKLSETLKPIELNDENKYIPGGVDVVASGWGLDRDPNAKLKYVNMKTITNDECKKIFGDANVIESSICTGDKNGACYGDGGGGLVLYQDGKPILIGIIAFVHPEGCDKGAATGYSRISSHRKWIKEISGL